MPECVCVCQRADVMCSGDLVTRRTAASHKRPQNLKHSLGSAGICFPMDSKEGRKVAVMVSSHDSLLVMLLYL